MVKKTNGTKSPMNTGAFKRVFGVLVVLLLASVLMVGAGSADSTEVPEVSTESTLLETVYVNASGLDTNDGSTEAKGVYNITKALELVKDNGKIIVLSGSYNYENSILIQKGVTIKGQGDTKPVVHFTNGYILFTARPDAVDSPIDITITGLNLSSESANAIIGNPANGYDSVEVQDGDISITDNEFTVKSGVNPYVYQSHPYTFANLTFTGNTIKTVDGNDFSGFVIYTDIQKAFEYTITGNVFPKCVADNGATIGGTTYAGAEDAKIDLSKNYWGGDAAKGIIYDSAAKLTTNPDRSSYYKSLKNGEIDETSIVYNLQDLIDAAAPGSKLELETNVAYECSGPLVISKAITLNGNGQKLTAPQISIRASGVELNSLDFTQEGAGAYTYAVDVDSNLDVGSVKVINSKITPQNGCSGFAVHMGSQFDVIFTGNTVEAADGKMHMAIYVDAYDKKYVFNDNIIGACSHKQFGFDQYLDKLTIDADISNNYWGGSVPVTELFVHSKPGQPDLIGADEYYTKLTAAGEIDPASLVSGTTSKVDTTTSVATDGTVTIAPSSGETTVEEDVIPGTEAPAVIIESGSLAIITPVISYDATTGNMVVDHSIPTMYVAPVESSSSDVEIGLIILMDTSKIYTTTTVEYDEFVVESGLNPTTVATIETNPYFDVLQTIEVKSTTLDAKMVEGENVIFPVIFDIGTAPARLIAFHIDDAGEMTSVRVDGPVAEGNKLTFYVYGSGFSSYAIVADNTPAQKPSSSGSSSGSSVWLTEPATPTEQPTQTPTEEKPTDTVPTDIPSTQPTATPASPGFGILAALAGLGAVAVLRRQ